MNGISSREEEECTLHNEFVFLINSNGDFIEPLRQTVLQVNNREEQFQGFAIRTETFRRYVFDSQTHLSLMKMDVQTGSVGNNRVFTQYKFPIFINIDGLNIYMEGGTFPFGL